MKRTFIVLALCILTTLGAQAQIIKPGQGKKVGQALKDGWADVRESIVQDTKPTGEHEPLSAWFYPKVGVALTDLTSVGGKPKIALTGGAGVEMFVHSRWSVGMELAYSHQGCTGVNYTLTDSETGEAYQNGPYKYCLTYLDYTFYGRWYPRAVLPLSVHAGLSMQRVLSAKTVYQGDDINLKSSHVRTGDLSIPIGVTYEFGQWAVDLSYRYGLFKLAKSDRSKRLLGNAHNMKLELTVAYRISIF